jgi:hypothetical protein
MNETPAEQWQLRKYYAAREIWARRGTTCPVPIRGKKIIWQNWKQWWERFYGEGESLEAYAVRVKGMGPEKVKHLGKITKDTRLDF